MQWCAACIYKAPLTSSYRGLSYSDPFGLCIEDACIIEGLVAAGMILAPELEAEAPEIEAELATAGAEVAERSATLVENLAESGEVRAVGEAAHHIVAKAAPRAEQARRVLQQAGVKINEAVNGVVLPAVKNYAGKAANHLTLHTNAYYDWVNQRLANAQTREEVIETLKSIKDALLNGTHTR
jgi:hypothetical protein